MIGAVIAVGLLAAAAVFAAVKRYRMTDRIGRETGCIVIPCSRAADRLEELVRAYYWEEIFENEKLARKIIIVVDREEYSKTAQRLAGELPFVSFADHNGE